MKPVVFLGGSRDDLRAFPEDARREAGVQLDRLQRGLEPYDWKPMASIGVGVREIRIRQARGAYRVIYIATFRDAVYILHAFQKKSQKTDKRDLDMAKMRFAALKRKEEQ